jgi:hypothetical protein
VHKFVWIGVLALCADAVSGSPVYDMAATFTGTRSVASGLASGGGNAYDNLLLSWSIAQKSDGTFDYSYAVSGFTSPALSHLILEVGADCLSASAHCVTNAKVGSTLIALSPAAFQLGDWCYGTSANPGVHCQGNSNIGLLKDILGVEFTGLPSAATVFITFNSTRAPVWGDIYMVGGQQYVYNKGMGNHSTDSNPLDFVARPDPATTLAETPEPASLALTGVALVLLALTRSRQRRRRGASEAL